MRTVFPRLAVIAWLALATQAFAQTLPVPPVPEPSPEPEEGAAPAPGTPAVPAPPHRRAWDYDFGVGGTYDTNVDFVDAEGGNGLFAVVPRASLARLFWGPRGETRLRASGRWVEYPEQADRGRGYGDFGLDGTYRTSPRTTVRLNASYELGYTDSSATLRDQGLTLALGRTSTIAAGAGLVHALGARTSLRLAARGLRTGFEAPELFDGTSARGTVALEQAFGARSTGAVVYALEEVLADDRGPAYATHYASLQWNRVLSPRSALLLEGGIGYTPDAERAGLSRKESFFGGATIGREVGRASLTAYVRREVTPAFGTGVSRPQLRSGLQADVPLSRLVTFRVSGTYVAAEEEVAAGGFPASLDASAALGWRVAPAFEVTAESSYRRRGALGSFVPVDAVTAGLFLHLSRPPASRRRPR
jgi:Putative beta-barrel porin 2